MSDSLHDSPQDFADLFAHGVIGLHFVGPDGVILNANQADLDILGYSRDEYIGHHIAEFHLDQDVIADILKRLAGNETLRDYEARLRAKDGSTRYVLINSNVLWDEGRFIHTRCFTRDITERKLHEQERERLIADLQRTQRALQEKVDELESFHDLVVDRELKMIELERRVGRLEAELAQHRHSSASLSLPEHFVPPSHS